MHDLVIVEYATLIVKKNKWRRTVIKALFIDNLYNFSMYIVQYCLLLIYSIKEWTVYTLLSAWQRINKAEKIFWMQDARTFLLWRIIPYIVAIVATLFSIDSCFPKECTKTYNSKLFKCLSCMLIWHWNVNVHFTIMKMGILNI